MNVVITMAGLGSRFRDAGFDMPKYRIVARGRTLFAWSMASLDNFLRPGARAIFVTRADDDARPFIETEMRAWPGVDAVEVPLDATTDGQATSALRAAAAWDEDAPLLVYNIDTHVDARWLAPEMARGNGWVPCFRAPGDHWSFVRTGPDGWAVELAEKRRISDLASIGLYWFGTARLFRDAYDRTYGGGRAPAGLRERYVAPVYNALIAEGARVSVSDVPFDAVVPLGTPEELAAFEARAGSRAVR